MCNRRKTGKAKNLINALKMIIIIIPAAPAAPFRPVMPSIRAVSQLVGAPIHSQVLLQCIVEAYPQPLMGWATNDGELSGGWMAVALPSIAVSSSLSLSPSLVTPINSA